MGSTTMSPRKSANLKNKLTTEGEVVRNRENVDFVDNNDLAVIASEDET